MSAPLLAAIGLTPVVSSGLSSPVFVDNAGDGSNRLFIVEQSGAIKVLQPGASVPTVFLNISSKITFSGERGLLGLAFHPNYATNGRFFVFYTGTGDGALVIAEYRVSADPNVASTAEAVLLTIPHPNNANHNGGMLAFGPDGYLYIGVGDGGSGNDPPNNAQNINMLLGKILRIDVDNSNPGNQTLYSSPADNPYFGTIPGRDEIFSIGWRNPWRFSFDRSPPHAQWVADVGQGAREEVDTPIVKGGNYGWRVYEGSICTGLDASLCNPANYLPPVFDYTHSGGRCSITGGYVYRGARGALPLGNYVFGDYCTGEIFAWDGSTQTLLLDTALSISSFGEDEQGELYVVNLGGSVSRINTLDPGNTFLDVDASGSPSQYDALTDGLLVIRYLFGFTGTPLTVGALSSTATRTDPAKVKAYLDGMRPALDIDGNGTSDALSDGLLVLRYLFGLRGAVLISGAVDPLGTRTTAPAIEAYIRSLMP
ncbi:MAG: PQQ-dependent sugar dehydrogenase [Betaproteobacteria bacterium]